MKKLISLILAALMLMTVIPVLADTATPTDLHEAPFTAFASICLCGDGELYYGDTVTLRADVKCSDDRPCTLDWQVYREDSADPLNSAWVSLGCSSETYTFTLTETNATLSYRVAVTFSED